MFVFRSNLSLKKSIYQSLKLKRSCPKWSWTRNSKVSWIKKPVFWSFSKHRNETRRTTMLLKPWAPCPRWWIDCIKLLRSWHRNKGPQIKKIEFVNRSIARLLPRVGMKIKKAEQQNTSPTSWIPYHQFLKGLWCNFFFFSCWGNWQCCTII